MSLIEQWQEKCTIIESKKVPDGDCGWEYDQVKNFITQTNAQRQLIA